MYRNHQELLNERIILYKIVMQKEKNITTECNLDCPWFAVAENNAAQLCVITCVARALPALPRTPGGISDFTSLSKGNPEP